MENKLSAIIHNLMNAKELLQKTTPGDTDIKNVSGENRYMLDQLETYSNNLLHNIERTSKITKG